MADLKSCKALTFDLFGTVLDLGGSLTPFIAEFIENKGADKQVSADTFWSQLRHRGSGGIPLRLSAYANG